MTKVVIEGPVGSLSRVLEWSGLVRPCPNCFKRGLERDMIVAEDEEGIRWWICTDDQPAEETQCCGYAERASFKHQREEGLHHV